MTHYQLIQIYFVLFWCQLATFPTLYFIFGLSLTSFTILMIFAFSILDLKHKIIGCHYLCFILLLQCFVLAHYLFLLRCYCVPKVRDFLAWNSQVFSCINFRGDEWRFVIPQGTLWYFRWSRFEGMFFLTMSFLFQWGIKNSLDFSSF